MSVLPTPCNCKPTIMNDDDRTPNDYSVNQTVHVHSPKLWITLVMMVGFVIVGWFTGRIDMEPKRVQTVLPIIEKQSVMSVLTTNTITLTNWVNLTNTVIQTVTQTNFTIVPIKTARVESAVVNNANVSVSGVRWRVLGVNDGDIMQLNYQLDNKEAYNITGIELLMTCYDGNKKIILKQILMDGSVNEDTPLMAYSAKPGQLAIPFEYSSLVKDVIVKVSGVRFR